MISSMTGFAQGSSQGDWGALRCEIRAVNHRYLEPQFRLPEALRAIEPALRECLRARVGRGKLECSIFHQQASETVQIELDEPRVEQLLLCARRIGTLAGTSAAINPVDILGWPGVQTESKPHQEGLQEAAQALFEQVLGTFCETRRREGVVLGDLIRQRIDSIASACAGAREVVPQILAAQQERIRARIAEAGADLEERYLEGELVLLAQKMDVAEELDRLEAHLDEVLETLEADQGPCGRRLDFLMQELNREANTLGSKSQGIDSTRHAVDMKVLIEQMREQIQNIE